MNLGGDIYILQLSHSMNKFIVSLQRGFLYYEILQASVNYMYGLKLVFIKPNRQVVHQKNMLRHNCRIQLAEE